MPSRRWARFNYANHLISTFSDDYDDPWTSIVDGDEQPDRPDSQTTGMEYCLACAA